ncbi:MAG: shikimate dehydrogenase [Chitinophagales bacterium]
MENIEDVRFVFEVEKDLEGLNVTIPFKESIIPYLDDLDPVAAAIGAVNCIHIDDIQKTGYNTDHRGFRESVKPHLKKHHKKALILGTGGSSKAVNYALQELGISAMYVSRNTADGILTYAALDKAVLDECPLIINCTPVGMYPNVLEAPLIPYQYLSPHHFCYDLVYNPEETVFLQKAKAHGAKTMGGLSMLHAQAECAWEIWNNQEEED